MKQHPKECNLTPFIEVTIQDKDGDMQGKIFTPECGCEACEQVIEEFIEMAEKMKEGCRDTAKIGDLKDVKE